MQYYSLKDFGIAGKTKDTTVQGATSNVVASAYDTSGNGGRKIVRLSNNWIVAVAYDSTGGASYFYVSKDNGATWPQLCYISGGHDSCPSIASSGTTVYAITTQAGVNIRLYKFDAATVTNIAQTVVSTPDSGQTALGATSLCIDGTGTLHAAWLSKNATFPQSFNIRYSKSTDGGATWAAVTSVTSANTSGSDYSGVCIIVRSNNVPVIFSAFTTVSLNRIRSITVGSAPVELYVADSYVQSNPCAAVDSNDVIHVVWVGKDSTVNMERVRYSKSTDGGATWAAMSIVDQDTTGSNEPSLTITPNNKLYCIYQGYDAAYSPSWLNIQLSTNDGTGWTPPVTKTTNTTNHAASVQTLWSKFNMNSADAVRWVYRDQQNTGVKYSSSTSQKVPDTTPTIVESYIPLWSADGTSATTTSSTYVQINDGGGTTSTSTASQAKLFTLSSNYPTTTKFAFEATIYTTSAANIATVYLTNMTDFINIAESGVTTTSTTAVVIRSQQFTLQPGKVYGVSLRTTNSSYATAIANASLVAFG